MKKSATNKRHDKIDILYTDEHICVINKDTGLLSVPSQEKDKSALSLLEEIMRKNGSYSPKHRPFPVHRLDKDTSGVMIFALTENVQKQLMDGWHKIVTERLYRAVAENPRDSKKLLPPSGLIDDELAFNAYNIGFVPKKKGNQEQKEIKTVPARTNFTTILKGKTHTLFELSLDTGKKNQIRAHLASKGYPLAGDKNFKAKSDNFGRLCLHARTLEFIHPVTKKTMRFEVPEPEEWKAYVEKGDLHPAKPSWLGEGMASQKESFIPVRHHISAKEKAHSNFIELGKRRR
ncbi:MAG: RluA family pseudouridine synthase [Treponema sp.]|nr:RluA family pseudouridine synthase [Treponema sp.]